MPRFNFDLAGARAVHDPHGMIFADCLVAAHFAEEMAANLGEAKPELRGTSSVVSTHTRKTA
jgi:hypothetical protein